MSNNKLPDLFENSTQFLDSGQILIQSQCLEKNIKWLCHFTPRSNLELIKQHGLVPRDNIQGSFIVTDEYRYDGNSDSTCLSISKPNKWMFEKKQQEGFDLCLLLINPEVLYLKRCAFYPYNAATASYREMPIERLMGVDAMMATFSDLITFRKSGQASQSYKRNSHLDTSEPTSDQAEVQCYETIEPEYIHYIIEEDIPLTYQEISRFVKFHEASSRELILAKKNLLESESPENEPLNFINNDVKLVATVDTIESEQLNQSQNIGTTVLIKSTPIDIKSTFNINSDFKKPKINSDNSGNQINDYSDETTAFLNRLNQLNMNVLSDYYKEGQDDTQLMLEIHNLNKKSIELLASNSLSQFEKLKIIEETRVLDLFFDNFMNLTSNETEPKQQEKFISRNNSSSADGCGSLIFIIFVVIIIMFIF